MIRRNTFQSLTLVALVLSILACSTDHKIVVEEPDEKALCQTQLDLVASTSGNTTGTFVTATLPGNGGHRFLGNAAKGCICAQISVVGEEEPYDSLNTDTVVSRTELWVNGEVLDVVAISEPPAYLEITSSGWPEGASATVPDAFGTCWHSGNLTPGNHEASLTYTTTSGDEMRYDWTFGLR